MQSVIIIEYLLLSCPLVQYIHHWHVTLEVMVFITCNQCTDLLLFAKLLPFTPFAMHGIVGKVYNNVLLVQIMLYKKLRPCLQPVQLVGPLFVRLSVLSYRLIRLKRYSHKQLCSLGFSSGFVVTMVNVWDDSNKCVTIIDNLC